MKNLLKYLLILFCSLPVNAVHLSSNGTGEVLVFPYYTVNGEFNTLITLVNSSDQAKAIRVRFREAANGREVFTFNLYLGSHDTWVGSMVREDTVQGGFTKLANPDISCTLPSFGIDGVLFHADNYSGDMQDAYGVDNKRMYEGFIEVIEMGVVTGESAMATIIDQNQPSASCSRLVDAWDVTSANNYWFDDSNIDMLPPSGGLMGSLVFIDVVDGTAMSEEAIAIADFSDAILHFSIDNDSPTLADGKTTSLVINKDGEEFNVSWKNGLKALDSVLMKTSLYNEYAVEEDGMSMHSSTDWIVTMPTRQYHTDPRYASTVVPIAPFSSSINNGLSCEPYQHTIYNREELIPIYQPSGPDIPTLCFASNNISIFKDNNNPSIPIGLFSSNYPGAHSENGNMLDGGEHIVVNPFENGWVSLYFQQSFQSIDESITITGLPVIGFSAQRSINESTTPGLFANHAKISRHKNKTYVDVIANKKAKSEKGQTSLTGMHLAKDGVGQVLIYPYYTVRNNLNTFITIVNTTDRVKALKIKFHEGKNAREVYDLNLYMSPFDVWTATLVSATSTISGYVGQESVKISTNDNSCTVPTINGQEFLPFAFSGAFDDGLTQDMERVTEGYIEVFEMGELLGEDAQAAIHLSDSIPQDCATLIANWSAPTGKWLLDDTINIQAPDGTGGLFGSASIIDATSGIDMSYEATAIVSFTTELVHTFPGSVLPFLISGNNNTTIMETEGGLLQTIWNLPANAVSALFMQTQSFNDFTVESNINAQSEWVNMYPTKQFYVDPLWSIAAPPVAPFTKKIAVNFGACENHRFKAYDREQLVNNSTGGSPIPDPLPPNYSSRPEDCWAVNVSDINMGSDNNTIFDSNLNINDWNNDNLYTSISDMPFAAGWLQKDFDAEISNHGKLVGIGSNGEAHIIYGKPTLGFVAQRYGNRAIINMNKTRRKILVDFIFVNGFEPQP